MKICPRLELVSIAKVLLIALLTIPQTIVSAQDCIYTDFTYTIGVNGEVTFKDISSSPTGVINSWTWAFGDGAILSPTTQNPVHRYNITNTIDPSVCFDVTLTVNDGTTTGISEPKHICIPTSTQSGGNSLYVKITSPTEIYDGACNNNAAKIIAGEQTAFEASVLGGTPPYTYNWVLPTGALPSNILRGPGPHLVTFPNAGATACPINQVSLEVTDVRGIKSTSNLNVSIRSKEEGPGLIKITASKLPICEGEEVIFKVKPDNPFGLSLNYLNVSVSATYRWLIDGVQFINSPLMRIPYTFRAGSVGSHEVRLEIKDGNSIYYAEPLRFTVQTAALCNVVIPPIPNFQLKVNGVENGTITLSGAGVQLCANSTTQKITIRVPRGAISIDNQSGDCLPSYLFAISIKSQDGVTRKFSNPCRRSDADYVSRTSYSHVITESLLRELGILDGVNYINIIDNKSIEFTLPICFANCGPLVGCNQLMVSVGRYSKTDLGFGTTCQCGFGNQATMGYFEESYTLPLRCNAKQQSSTPLLGMVKRDLKTMDCGIKVTDNYPPLSISGINSIWDCKLGNYQFDVKGKISGGASFQLAPDAIFINCSESAMYKKVQWKAFYFSNPNREIIDNFVTWDINNNKYAKVDGNHAYFSTFAPDERRVFIIEVSVADAEGNVVKYAEVVGFDPPLRITLADKINLCKTDNTPLSNNSVVVGGKLSYTYTWSSPTPDRFSFIPTSTTDIPSLNLQNVTSPVTINLMVKDDNGCTTSKVITITPIGLNPISFGNVTINACRDNSSTQVIGPREATANTITAYLGGSGNYSYKWTSDTAHPNGLDYLSDPTIPYPTVIGENPAITYILVVTDLLGGCQSSSDKVTVQGWKSGHTVNLKNDKILCAQKDNTVELEAETIVFNTVQTRGFTYKWTSNDPNFSASTTSNKLLLNHLPNGSINTYIVTAIDDFSSCSVKDEIVVDIKKDWTYKGYEAVTAPLLEGLKGPLWKSTDNEIFANGANGSGAVAPFTYVFLPSPPIDVTNIIEGNFGVIKQASLSSNGTTVIVRDSYGCSKSLPSNTYYKLSKNPTLLVSSNRQVVCSNGEICFYLTLNTNIAVGQQYLPVSFNVPYQLRASFLINGIWENREIVRSGNLEFVLTDAVFGIYTAIQCMRIGTVSNLSHLTLLIDSGLPNNDVTGAGRFKAEYRFNASPSGPVRSSVRINGIYVTRTVPDIAFDYVSLGTREPTKKNPDIRSNLIIGNNVHAEFAASPSGQVLAEFDVDVQASAQYFHAFIDPCFLPLGFNAAQQTEESSLFIKNTENIPKGAFTVHPSPFASDITLNYEVRVEKGSTINLTVYNGLGQLIDKIYENRFHSFGVFSAVYDTGKLTTGIYIFELTIDGEKFIRKSMKIE
jgi:hypothetical protein